MNNLKMDKRKMNGMKTKEKIYEVAKKMIREQGFENVSVDAIVEKAGVSKGAFYVHFESKDALGALLINDASKEADMDYGSLLKSIPPDMDPSDTLILLIAKVCDFIAVSIGYENIKTLYRVHLTKTVDSNSAISYNRELYKMFKDVFKKGMDEGIFKKDLPLDKLSQHCVLAIRGLTYEWCIRYPEFDLKAQALEHFRFLFDGILSTIQNSDNCSSLDSNACK